MSRHPRIVVPGQPQHVITRGNNRRRLFSYDGDYLRFLRYLAEALERTECHLHAITLMANHVHMVMTPRTEQAVAAAVRRVSQRYAIARNRAREATGKLFEQRYVSIPITDDRQLAMTTLYCDANALRAGLVGDGVDYPWSTYAIHAGASERSRVPVDIWTPSAWYSALGEDAAARAAAYRECAAECLVADRRPEGREQIEAIEELSAVRYTRRLERPNGTRAV